MLHQTLPWILLVAGCATNNGSNVGGDAGGSGSGSSDAGGGVRPPFTNGVSTLAGDAPSGFLDGSRQVNLFNNPVNVLYSPDGRLYVADFDNGKVRSLTADGTSTTVVAQANFSRPFGMALAPNGFLYVSTDNDPNGAHSLQSGTVWRVDVDSHTAAPIAVAIGRPRALIVLADGRIAASDDLHHVIELINPQSGAVTVIAGTWDAPGAVDALGAAARFSSPYGIVQRADGKLVVCDFANHRLRLVALDGTVTTLAGSVAGFVDGAMAGAMLNHPQGLAIATNGDLYVSDIDNFRVRRITATTIETIAGDGTDGYLDSDDRLGARLHGLEGLTVTPDGSMVYVADGTRGEDVLYNRVRQIKL